MTANVSELAALRTVATCLGPIREEVVFVGGMIRSLLSTDPGAPAARPTDDTDVVAAVGSQTEYYALAARRRALGFREDQREHAPLCRWLIDGLTVDVMPDHENVLGFSNRWYRSARATASWFIIGCFHGRQLIVKTTEQQQTKKLEFPNQTLLKVRRQKIGGA